MLKYYMNNPCTVVREVAGEFSEVKLIPNWVDDFDGSQWCIECMVGNQGTPQPHTCDEAQEIIDHINESQAAIVVMVENRLLHEEPVELKPILSLQEKLKKFQLHISECEKHDAELGVRQEDKYSRIQRLDIEISKKEDLVAKYNDELNTLENDIDRLKSRKAIVVENTKTKVGTVNIPICELEDLLKYEVEIERLESGGVDNWDWYGESLNPDNQPSVEEEVENRLNTYIK